MTDTWYDVVVIGAGPVGENVADTATQAGLSCVVVESELVGGECSYWACIPSKALLRPGAARDAALRVQGASESVTGSLDGGAVLTRRDGFVSSWDDSGQAAWLDGAGIALVRGHARLAGEKTVEVETETGAVTLRARHAVAICTGSAALIPDVPGLAEADPWTSREATSAQEIPESVAILGGGVVGAEMATAYTSLGSRVTLIVRGRLLSGHEDIAGDAVAARLRERGATVLTANATDVTRDTDGTVHVELDNRETVIAAELIVATGRVPRTSDIGLESVGLKPGSWLDVNDSMRVTAVDGDWLYAVGDVNHRALVTHQGKYQARAAGRAIAARAAGDHADPLPWTDTVASADHTAVPAAVFTDPEVAAVGLTSAAAAAAGLRTRVIDYDLGSVSGSALLADGYTGTVRAVIDEDRGVLVGITFVGQDVTEMLHAATIAVVGQVPLDRLWHAVPAFPTMSEVWLRLLETYRADA
ncbi:NAD(P)/FAD-dependent oxidoreductase [Okibacterium endophyticum]